MTVAFHPCLIPSPPSQSPLSRSHSFCTKMHKVCFSNSLILRNLFTLPKRVSNRSYSKQTAYSLFGENTGGEGVPREKVKNLRTGTGGSKEAGDVLAHLVLPVGPIMSAFRAPVVQGMPDPLPRKDFGQSVRRPA